MIYAFPHLDRLAKFIVERHQIYKRRAGGAPAPWTKDPILRQYRFCNVYRELDRVTLWITDHWRTPHARYDHLWFSIVIARLINRPETLAEMAFPGRWNRQHFLSVMRDRKARNERQFGSAYIVSTAGVSMDKAKYLAEYVLDPMWNRRHELRPKEGDTLGEYHARLRQFDGMGSFMAAQIVADMKYVSPLREAKDWWTFASSGPGSQRGMHYVMGNDPRAFRWREHEWRDALYELADLIKPYIKTAAMPRLHNQDLQNCLCEFSKYRRTQLGTGRPKQIFTPFTGD